MPLELFDFVFIYLLLVFIIPDTFEFLVPGECLVFVLLMYCANIIEKTKLPLKTKQISNS